MSIIVVWIRKPRKIKKPVDIPDAVRRALDDLQKAVASIYGDQVPEIIIYCSYARGDANPTSDLDVLLLYSTDIHSGQEIHRLRNVLAKINLRYEVLISLLPVSQIAYQDSNQVLWKNIRNEGVAIDAI